MKKHRIVWMLGVSMLLMIVVFLWWYFAKRSTVEFTSPQPSPVARGIAINALITPPLSAASATPSDQAEQRDMIIKILETPINFWGKVTDEKNNPVSDAQIQFSVLDKWMSDQGTKYSGKSDANGLFSIAGIKGAGLHVDVSKEGYYQTGQSGRLIGYGILNEHKLPSPSDPAIFVLRKMGQAEPLKTYSSGGIRVPKNGEPVSVSLIKGYVVSSGQGDIQVEVWTQDQQKDAQGRYPWKCRISVPGGGLIERKGNYDFVAPEDGYKSADEIEMTLSAKKWSLRIDDKEYFVKLSGGTFGRIKFGLTTGGDHFFWIESFYNPSGSRNLEFDPNKTIKSP